MSQQKSTENTSLQQKYQTKKEKVTFGYTVEVFITLS